MNRTDRDILDRLGQEGLGRVLDDLLDQPRLVRLANSCGLKYPGMRTQSQKRQRILADLVREAGQRAMTRKAIFRALRKETRTTTREWLALSSEQRQQRLADESFLMANGNLGRHLFVLAIQEADTESNGFPDLLGRVAAPAAGPAAPAETKASREEIRLNKRVTQLQRKTQHVEAQLAKSRESEKSAKRDLIQRKGELAESRMLVERLRSQLDAARQVSADEEKKKKADSGDEAVARLGEAVRKLASEQKKLTRRLDKLASAPAPAAVDLSPIVKSIRELDEQLAGRQAEWGQQLQQHGRQIELLRSGLPTQRKVAAKPSRRTRPKGEAARVGVFIDVQNMYYGARRLRGKLDFEAMLRAAVADRRMSQATAYMVESKEIDQSGFISVLQQLAITVRRKTLRVRADGSMKGDWDMELALDILDAAPKLDVVVLVSGDGDFTSLVKRVQRMGARVEVMAFPRNTAKALLEAADRFQPLDRKFMIYPTRTSRAKAPARSSGRKSAAALAPAGE